MIMGDYVHIDADDSALDDTVFNNAHEYWNVPPVLIYNSSFVNGLAQIGGAINSIAMSNLEIRRSSFDYNRAYEHGGAINVYGIFKARLSVS